MLKIVVLLGGNSPERKVSLVTGSEISSQLKQNGHQVIEIDPADYGSGHELIRTIAGHNPDLVFIGLHGGEGENGVLQAMLTGSRIPFTGSGFKASAVAMDKLLSKYIAERLGIPVPAYRKINLKDYDDKLYPSFEKFRAELKGSNADGRLVVKPVDAGSSVGVHIISEKSDWAAALQDAFQYSDRVMIEAYIAGRELTVTMLDEKALPVVEISPNMGFYDYTNKYTAGHTSYHAPADLTSAEEKKIQDYAMRIWKEMECSGYGRIDFRFDGSTFFFLEVNTLPGMTPLSLTPMAAKAVGHDFGDLLDRIIQAVQPYK